MQSHVFSVLESLGGIARQGALLALTFLDDVVLLGFSQLGWQWVWLQWLSTALLTATVAYWVYRIVRYCLRRYGTAKV